MSIPISGALLIEIGAGASDVMGALLGVDEREAELLSKGYTEEQAALMINFELGYALTAANLTGVFALARTLPIGGLGASAFGALTTPTTYPFYREGAQIISETVVDNGQDLSEKEFSIDLPGFNSFKIRLKDNFTTAEEQMPAFDPDPMILDLDGDGIETTTLENGVYFDHDNNGFAENMAWAGADDGLIVNDINADGVINNGGEVVQTFADLSAYDTNSDNIIDIKNKITKLAA